MEQQTIIKSIDGKDPKEWAAGLTDELTKLVEKKKSVPSYVQKHKDLCIEIHNLYKKKNADYGSSFHQTYKKFGITAALVRMSDKWERLINLASGSKAKVNDESLRDTMMDLAGYLLLTIMELDAEAKKNDKA